MLMEVGCSLMWVMECKECFDVGNRMCECSDV